MSSTTTRSVTHDTFTLERRYDAAPARVFAAFPDQEAKKQWFGGGDGWASDRWDLDFRVGGREVNHSHLEGGPSITFESTFQDIVENERIVYGHRAAARRARGLVGCLMCAHGSAGAARSR